MESTSRFCQNFMGDSCKLILSIRWRSNLHIMHGCLLSGTMGCTHSYYVYTHTTLTHAHTTVTLVVWADLSCSIDSTSSFSLVWSKQGALTEISVFVWILFAHLFSSTCACCSHFTPLEKVVRALCPSNSFRIHDPDSCLFFPL